MDEICSICSKIFKNKAGLRAHKSAVHAEKNYACDVCDKKFKKKDQLNTHISTHQDSIDICYACGITFTQKNNWTKHMKIYHLPQNFKCNHCPKSFIDKKALKKHVDACTSLSTTSNQSMSFLDAFKESGNIVEKKEKSKNQQ